MRETVRLAFRSLSGLRARLTGTEAGSGRTSRVWSGTVADVTNSALLPNTLRTRLTAFINEHRRLAPGLLDRVVVTESATTSDWWEGTSDIDLVLVIRRAPSQDEMVAPRELHRSTISEGPVDGVYLTEQQLAEGPDTVGAAPQVVEGALDTQARGAQLTWVTWH